MLVDLRDSEEAEEGRGKCNGNAFAPLHLGFSGVYELFGARSLLRNVYQRRGDIDKRRGRAGYRLGAERVEGGGRVRTERKDLRRRMMKYERCLTAVI